MRSETLIEAGRRRTFAIISHPDAGKTTLTEKFLLSIARRTDPESALALKGLRNVAVLARTDGTLLALFSNDFWLEQVRKRQPEATLEPLFAG